MPASYLFTGHMVDADDRKDERFPSRIVGAARSAIEKKLDELGAGRGDFALCQGACGGDLLFARAALERGMQLALVMPFDEPEFIARSVASAGDEWVVMFQDVSSHPNTAVSIILPAPGQDQDDSCAFELANIRMLDCAAANLGRGLMLALWDGRRSGKRGGTDQMVDMAIARGFPVSVIDSKTLF